MTVKLAAVNWPLLSSSCRLPAASNRAAGSSRTQAGRVVKHAKLQLLPLLLLQLLLFQSSTEATLRLFLPRDGTR